MSVPAPLFLAVHALLLGLALVLLLAPRDAVSSAPAGIGAGQAVCVAPASMPVAQELHEGATDRG